jgi:hypothetical protein
VEEEERSMSRRLVTTITVSVRLRIPPGSNAKQVLAYIGNALALHKEGGDKKQPINSIDTDSMAVKLVSRETTYL